MTLRARLLVSLALLPAGTEVSLYLLGFDPNGTPTYGVDGYAYQLSPRDFEPVRR